VVLAVAVVQIQLEVLAQQVQLYHQEFLPVSQEAPVEMEVMEDFFHTQGLLMVVAAAVAQVGI
jgi:hypothetical protein